MWGPSASGLGKLDNKAVEGRALACHRGVLEDRLRLAECKAELRMEAMSALTRKELAAQRRSTQSLAASRRAQWEEQKEAELKDTVVKELEPLLQGLEDERFREYVVGEERLSEALAAQDLAAEWQLRACMAEHHEEVEEELCGMRKDVQQELHLEWQTFVRERAKVTEEWNAQRHSLLCELDDQVLAAEDQLAHQRVATSAFEQGAVEMRDALMAQTAHMSKQLLVAQRRANVANAGLSEASHRLQSALSIAASERLEVREKLEMARNRIAVNDDDGVVATAQRLWDLSVAGALAENRTLLTEARVELAAAERCRWEREVQQESECKEALCLARERLEFTIEDGLGLSASLSRTRSDLAVVRERCGRAESLAYAYERRRESYARRATWSLGRDATVAASAGHGSRILVSLPPRTPLPLLARREG